MNLTEPLGDQWLQEAVAWATLRERVDRCPVDRHYEQQLEVPHPIITAYARCALTAGHDGMHIFVITGGPTREMENR